MSLISTNQTIHHPEIGDFYWMTVRVDFLIEFNMSTVHTVAVHFRYDRYMRRVVNELLSRNPIVEIIFLFISFRTYVGCDVY